MSSLAPLAVLVALSAGASPPQQTPCVAAPLRPGPLPWRPGEQLVYDLDVMGIVKAGTLQSDVLPPLAGSTELGLRARARNTSVFAKVKHVKAQGLSWIDPRTLRPRRYRDDSDENGLRRTTEARFTPPASKVSIAWTIGEKKGVREFDRTAEVFDLVSAIFYLRAAELATGQTFCFDVVANRRFWRLEGTLAAGTERVDTPAGTFDAVRVDATLTRTPTADDPKVRTRPLHLWLSSDPRRIPVAAVSEVDLGPVRSLLARGAAPRR